MRHIALEVPLRALALGRRGQRHGAADARVETLRHSLDRPALASRVASLEDDDQLELLRHNPVLQLDELTLQTQQLLEIESPRQGIVQLEMFALRQQVGELVVFKLELDVLVEIILDLGVDALPELADRSLLIRSRFVRAHGRLPLIGALAKTRRRRCGTLQRWVRQFCDRAPAVRAPCASYFSKLT